MSAGVGGACAGGAGAGPAGASLGAALQFLAAAQCLLTEHYPPQAMLRNGTCFDFVIVGGGTAGSALAARLALAPSAPRVLLIEAGGDPPQEAIIPGFRDSLKGGAYDWKFTTVDDHFASQALLGGSQKQPRGRMLGGTGSLNDMVYSRGSPKDYEEWAAVAGHRWTWDNVLDYYKKTEHLSDENIINDPELMKNHGRDGEIEVSGRKESTFETDRFLDAFKELGFTMAKDMSWSRAMNAGRFSHTIRDGRRDSSLSALLNKAADRHNVYVLKDALATKVLIENNTAYGVEVLFNNDELQFFARKEVILSAGTFNTPKLLLLSGVGPKDHLQTLGINVVKDTPVGENLQDHVMVLNYLAADNGTCYTDQKTAYMDIIKYFYDQSGSLSINNGVGAYFALKGSSQPEVPDFAFYPSCIQINAGFYEPCVNILGFKPSICTELDTLNRDHELLSIAVVLLKPKSRGTVRLSSINPSDNPLISSETFRNSEDLDGYPEAISIVRSLAETKYFKQKNARVVDLAIEECGGVDGREAVKCRARAVAMSAWHAVGTAAVGGVVGPTLAVRGLVGLRVVDASVMPQVTRGNTNAPVVMIAEKAADFIKADYGL